MDMPLMEHGISRGRTKPELFEIDEGLSMGGIGYSVLDRRREGAGWPLNV
jgi:hypothetical protein